MQRSVTITCGFLLTLWLSTFSLGDLCEELVFISCLFMLGKLLSGENSFLILFGELILLVSRFLGFNSGTASVMH